MNTARADDTAWLPVRDQNPFVLGSGLPLLPQAALPAGNWSFEAGINESNTQLISTLDGGRIPPKTQVVFGGETREARVSVSYALSDDWTARASLGDFWFGVGFLNDAIDHFHSLIGAPKGYRDGRLGERTPVARVTENGVVLYALDQPGQSIAPLLIDLTRSWRVSDTTRYGLSLGVKLPTGDTNRLADAGDHAVSVSAFGDWVAYDFLQVGARVGLMHASGNDLLPTLARTSVPFADVYARMRVIGEWSAELQYDAHAALYRNAPNFLSNAGSFSFGLVHPLGKHAELVLGLSEDLPIDHTQDVSFLVSFRYRPGN
jgi:hypothetical protein